MVDLIRKMRVLMPFSTFLYYFYYMWINKLSLLFNMRTKNVQQLNNVVKDYQNLT